MAVGVDHPGLRMIRSAQGFGQEPPRRLSILFDREQKIEGGARGVHRSVLPGGVLMRCRFRLVRPHPLAGPTFQHFRDVSPDVTSLRRKT